MSQRREPDPFGPLEGAVTFLLGILLSGLILFGGLWAFEEMTKGSSSVSIATVGDDRACAVVSAQVVPGMVDIPQRGIRRDVASVRPEQVEVCVHRPTFDQKAASALEPVGSLVFVLGGLFLTRRVIRGARRKGLFTDGTARRTRELGWFLLVMGVVWPFVAAAGRGVIVQAAVATRGWTDELLHPEVSFTVVLVALGVLTVARVLRRAVALQEEVDATV